MQQIVCCLLNKLKDQGQWSTAAKTIAAKFDTIMRFDIPHAMGY